jgi:hypothetical protein
MAWAKADPDYVPPTIDIMKPSVARVYDAILGGKDNFAVDREVARQAIAAMGDGGDGARMNRAALGRAVRFMAAEGIDQFLDLGSGLPTAQNTHQIAQSVNPAARVVYVDNDPSVSIHGQALLADDASTRVIFGDMREPATLLGHPRIERYLDFDRPLGLILNAVVHHLLDEEDPYGIVATFKDVLAPGSMMQLTHFSDASAESKANEQVLKQSLGRGQVRTRAEIAAFFDGLEILPPGLVFLPEWRPESPLPVPLPAGATLMLVGVGRKG